jgi:hypothetical protein
MKEFFRENKISIAIVIASLIIGASIYLSKLAPVVGIAGVIVGWLLNSLTNLVKERSKRNKLLKLLLAEIRFNQGAVSYGYLYFADSFRELIPSVFKKDKETILNATIQVAFKKELGWGFKTSSYDKAESEGILRDLPSYGEIMGIYRTVFSLQQYGIPQDKVGWTAVRRKLEELKKSLDLVIENFYEDKEGWIRSVKKTREGVSKRKEIE